MTSKRTLAITILAAAALTFGAAPAQAEKVDRKEVPLTVSAIGGMQISLGGEINRQILYADNGTNVATGHTDNSAFPSYLRLHGRTASGYGNGMSWGFKLEEAITSNPSETFDFNTTNNTNDGISTRAAYVWVKDDWGKISMGRGPGAARYSARNDLSGTEKVHNFDSRRASNIYFVESGGGVPGIDVGSLFANSWGLRGDQIAYKSPTLAGFNVQASYGNENEQEYSLNYSNFGWADDILSGDGLRVKGSVGHARNVNENTFGGDDSDARTLGSVSVLHVPTGLNASLGYVNQDPGRGNVNDHTTWSSYVKLGKRWGDHSLSADYGISRGAWATTAAQKVEGTLFGLGYAWNHGPYGLGLGVEQYQADFVNTGLPSIDNVRVFATQFNVNF